VFVPYATSAGFGRLVMVRNLFTELRSLLDRR
jgi:hypothetical protein